MTPGGRGGLLAMTPGGRGGLLAMTPGRVPSSNFCTPSLPPYSAQLLGKRLEVKVASRYRTCSSS